VGSPNVVAAAHAAASWVRARRAAWIDDAASAPHAAVAFQIPAATRSSGVETSVVGRHEPVTVRGDAAKASLPSGLPSRSFDASARAGDATPAGHAETIPAVADASATPASSRVFPADLQIHADPGAASSWWPRLAIAAVAVAGVLVVGRYAIDRLGRSASNVADAPASSRSSSARSAEPSTAGAAEPSTARAATTAARGSLRVESTPPGAQVIVDGKARGVTPLSIADLPAGAHTLELASAEGTVRRTIAIAANKTTAIAESIFAGWVAVHAPFDVAATEGTRALRADERGQILLPPGPHDLRLVNRTLAYDQVHHVEVKPGEIAQLAVPLPRSTLSVTANEPAEVWVDGVRIGSTPLADAPVDVGTRDIVVKRAAGGERKVTVTVTMKPYALAVDFAKIQN
jgi:hypothetical protein